MSKSDDDILAHELGNLGKKGAGFVGGSAGLGGYLGGKLVVRLLPNDTYELSGIVKGSMASLVARATNVLIQQGKLVHSLDNGAEIELKGVFGAGILNMNPAVVTIWISSASDTETQIRIQGTAKEGLIKQRAGEKAARRIAELVLS